MKTLEDVIAGMPPERRDAAIVRSAELIAETIARRHDELIMAAECITAEYKSRRGRILRSLMLGACEGLAIAIVLSVAHSLGLF